MFGNIGVEFEFSGSVYCLSLEVGQAQSLEYALRTNDSLADVRGRIRILMAIAFHAKAVAHIKVDCEVRESVAKARARQVSASAAESCRHFDWEAVVAKRPHQYVDVMDVLLDNMVAGNPDEAPPVAYLVFERVLCSLLAAAPRASFGRTANIAAVVPIALSG